MSEPRTEKLVVDDRLVVPLDEFQFRFARSGGPGGQNVNKVNSKVTLHWPVATSPSVPEDVRDRFLARYRRRVTKTGEVVVISQRFRDQSRNREDCLDRLRQMLREVAVAPPRRKPTRPTRGSRQRRLQEKRVQSEKKQMRKDPRSD